jgi:hypothetical protein
MSVADKEEAHVDILEDIKSNKKVEESKNKDVLVLSIAVVSLQVESGRVR